MRFPRHLVIHARPTGRRGQDRGLPHDREAEPGVEGDVARLLRRQRDAVAVGVGLGEGLAQAPPAHAHPLPARADDDALEPAERPRAAARAAGFEEGPIEAVVARLHLEQPRERSESEAEGEAEDAVRDHGESADLFRIRRQDHEEADHILPPCRRHRVGAAGGAGVGIEPQAYVRAEEPRQCLEARLLVAEGLEYVGIGGGIDEGGRCEARRLLDSIMAQRLEGADGGDVRHHFPAPNTPPTTGDIELNDKMLIVVSEVLYGRNS